MSGSTTAPTLPKFDLNGLVALQKANIETAMKAQTIVAETTRAIIALHTGWMTEVAQKARTAMRAGVVAKPEALVADASAAAKRALIVARQELNLGVRAQGEVVDLIAKRAAANLDGVKALAVAA